MDHNDYLKAKVEATSGHNDGWTQKFYQDLIDAEHKATKEGYKCKEGNQAT